MDKKIIASELQASLGGRILATPKQISKALHKDFRNLNWVFEQLDFLPDGKSHQYLVKEVASVLAARSEPTLPKGG